MSRQAGLVASGLATLAANGLEVAPIADAERSETSHRAVNRALLAGNLAHGERYVGTAGGGMDQAVCLLARAGTALRIWSAGQTPSNQVC